MQRGETVLQPARVLVQVPRPTVRRPRARRGRCARGAAGSTAHAAIGWWCRLSSSSAREISMRHRSTERGSCWSRSRNCSAAGPETDDPTVRRNIWCALSERSTPIHVRSAYAVAPPRWPSRMPACTSRIRVVMSARSRPRPISRNAYASSWLIVPSSKPGEQSGTGGSTGSSTPTECGGRRPGGASGRPTCGVG